MSKGLVVMLSVVFLFVAGLSVVQAQFTRPPLSAIGEKINAAMASDIRSDKETKRDANRKPRQTLEFFGLKEDMRVIELVPGGGWYTKILAPVLADKGELFIAVGTTRLEGKLKEHDSLSKVKALPIDAEFVPAGDIQGLFTIGEFALGIDDIDMVLTFRNLHNFVPEARANIDRAVFEALKPGGVYGVVDHTRRHNEPQTKENWRRMDPVTTIKEIQAAGFELVDSSALHYRADDELRYEVGRKTVTGNTDRFTLLFRKPE